MIIECEKFFEEFVSRYDSNSEKINLKIRHTRRVEEICRIIAESLNLTEKKVELAQVIGLCHDLGRFYQVKHYGTFNDLESIDHAEASNKILFEEGYIQKFLPQNGYAYIDIIRHAVYNHNKLDIEHGLDRETLIFCKIIRDADKIDIYRVMATAPFDEVYSSKDRNNFDISDSIRCLFYSKSAINNKLKVSILDDFVCRLAFVFDLNYKKSKELLKEYGYLDDFVNNFIMNSNIKDERRINEIKDMYKFALNYLNA